MDTVIRALQLEGLSSDQFLDFVSNYGIQEDSFVQDILRKLVMTETLERPVSPMEWTSDEADELLRMLETPPKTERQCSITDKASEDPPLPGQLTSDKADELLRMIQSSSKARPTEPQRTALRERDAKSLTRIQNGRGDTSSFQCPQCGKGFNLRHNLNRHIKGVHDKVTHSCTKCGKTYTQSSKLRNHQLGCHGPITFPCGQCDTVLNTKRELAFHSKIKHKANPAPRTRNSKLKSDIYSCRHCDAEFRHIKQLRMHNDLVHELRGARSPQPGSSVEISPQPGTSVVHELRGARSPQPGSSVEISPQPGTSVVHELRGARSPQPGSSVEISPQPGTSGEGRNPGTDSRYPQPRPSSGAPDRDGRISDSSPKPGPSSYRCRRCTAIFPDRRALHAHTMERHYQVGSGSHPEPFDEGEEPWINADGTVDEGLRDCYRTNRVSILERYREGPVDSIYNIPMFAGMTIADINEALRDIYDRQRQSFKVNLSFGFIMKHTETGRHRYFRPFDNVNIFDAPILISSRSDLVKVLKKLKALDILNEMAKNRPDTKWRLVLFTNIRVKLYNTNFALGAADNWELPVYITRNKSILSLDKDPVTFRPYKDHLCLFRCLSLHRYGSTQESKVRELFVHWQTRFTDREYDELLGNDVHEPQFRGVQLREIPEFEQRFSVNVKIYSLDEDNVVVPVFKSTERYADTMVINRYENHCSYVTEFSQYAKKFKCELCDRLFDHHGNFKRHAKTCDQKTLFHFPGGFYRPSGTVFEQLTEFGVIVPTDNRIYPWFAVFDFESILSKLEGDATEKLEWTHRHDPISVSVCSNLPGYTEPRCFVDTDLDVLLKRMVEALTEMQARASELALEKWGEYLDELKGIVKQLSDDDDDPEQASRKEKAESLYGRFKAYTTILPVLGFNSAKYDLNLVKRKLAKHLRMHEQEHGFVVKKTNAYACLTTDQFRFLDISHFLAPGTSYAGFLKAYRVEEIKGYFPYQWFDSPTKLDYPELPPREAFYSDLKGVGISQENYDYCRHVWSDLGMTRFRDFLVWYNNLDVGPFVTAVERLQQFYVDKGIDVLKTAMSVPGIARQLLFQAASHRRAEFSLVDQRNADLYESIKRNIVGGPSIIFTRHHETGRTRLRGGKTCRNVVGYDANALYLWAIGQPMPEGMFVRRRADNQFKPEHRDKYMQAFNWLNYLIQYEGKHISHQRNRGREVRIGKYPVDGFDPDSNTVYEFQGCYHHGHVCHLTENVKSEKWHKTKDTLQEKSRRKVAFLRSQGFKVVEMYECQFSEFCKAHPKIYALRDKSRPDFCRTHKGAVTERQILNGVRFGILFGMIECDIQVPEEWDNEFRDKISLPPDQYFEEMCPIFCNTDVGFDDIGEHMRAHVKEYQLSDAPRRLLIGGTKARQILLATPLLKWYLDHGMKVTKIYQVVEYRKLSCFDSFVREVSDARRAGDECADMAIIADTMKLIGNSGYGSLIMDKTKHRRVYYVEGENKACFEINKPQFRQSTCLDEVDDYYEIEAAKGRIKLDLPIQLGFYILQYAKLRMLEFYYDLLDRYVDRADFEYLEMDTDSAYMALSAPSLREVIKPEKMEEYQRGLAGLCDDQFDPVGDRWFPRECCAKHAKFDRRVPGLFKTEYQGDQMIGLCSKTYVVSKSVPSKAASAIVAAALLLKLARKWPTKRLRSRRPMTTESKFSSKRVSKRLVKNPLAIFKRVLRTQQAASGRNKGFRVRNNGMYSYEQTRCGFSYFYCKRRVLEDGVHTVPLDITLCPVKPDRVRTEEPVCDIIDELTVERSDPMLVGEL